MPWLVPSPLCVCVCVPPPLMMQVFFLQLQSYQQRSDPYTQPSPVMSKPEQQPLCLQPSCYWLHRVPPPPSISPRRRGRGCSLISVELKVAGDSVDGIGRAWVHVDGGNDGKGSEQMHDGGEVVVAICGLHEGGGLDEPSAQSSSSSSSNPNQTQPLPSPALAPPPLLVFLLLR